MTNRRPSPRSPLPRRPGWMAATLWLASCVCLLASPLAAQGVLIVNSDRSVPRYAVPHASFKDTLERPTEEIDLGSGANSEAALRRLIDSSNPSVVYCIGSQAYVSTTNVAKNRNIIVSSALNVRRFPTSLRTFGIASELPPAAQMTVFRLLFPKVRRIGVLYSADYNGAWVREAEAQDADVDLQVVARQVRRPGDLPGALAALLPVVDVLWLIPDPIVLSDAKSIDLIFAEADKRSKAIFAYDAAFATRGAALAIAADVATTGRQAARLAEDLLAGRSPTEAVQSPAGSELTVNMRSVTKYRLELNRDALPLVNSVIQ